MKTASFSFALLLMLALLACSKSNDTSACPDGVEATFRDLTGLDGCGYVLELKDGSILEVVNLDQLSVTPEEGLKVRVKYNNAPNFASICMAGTLVTVDCIALDSK